MKQAIDFSLILPCFNEAKLFDASLARIIQALDAGAYSYEIIFVDDASKDKTVKLIKKACKRYQFCHAIFHTINTGRGQSVMDGVRKARAPVVGFIDIDCEVSPVYLPHMVSLIRDKRAAVVIGRRHYRSSPSSMFREILSRGYQWIADALIGTGGMDTETGYKVFDKRKILPLFDRIEEKGWFWDTEIMVYAKRARLNIIEVPVLFLRRFDKVSSVHIVKDTRDYLIHLWKLNRKLYS